jgi:hypothetical protein
MLGRWEVVSSEQSRSPFCKPKDWISFKVIEAILWLVIWPDDCPIRYLMRQHQLDCQLAYSWPQKPQVEANEAYITTRVNIKLHLDQLIC